MSTKYKHVANFYDKYCKKSCSLRLGFSTEFENRIKSHQHGKSCIRNSTLHDENTVTAVSDDPLQKIKFQSILNDPVFKSLNHPTDHDIFRVALQGMERNYPTILNGQQKHLMRCPTAFNYDSRIKSNESSVPETLEKRKKILEENVNRNVQEEKDLKVIKDHLSRIQPQISEGEVFTAFEKFFHNQRGILIHSFKLDSHLKVFIDKAYQEKTSNDDSSFKFSPLEQRIANALNIEMQELQAEGMAVLERLNPVMDKSKDGLVNGFQIHKIIDETLIGDVRSKAKSKFHMTKEYTKGQIMRAVRLSKFESICKLSGENDFFVILPDRKLMLSVEVKRHMKSNDDQNHRHIDGNLKCASDQLLKNADYTAHVHGEILRPGWKMAKVAVISPHVYKKEKICPTCSHFILTTDMLKEPNGLKKWWKMTSLEKVKELNGKSKQDAYDDFLKLFFRLVMLSAVKIIPRPFNSWQQIQGNNPRHMSAGYTESEKHLTTNELNRMGSGIRSFNEILQRPHDAYKVICMNEDQEALLVNDIPFVVFLNDFGAGTRVYFIKV